MSHYGRQKGPTTWQGCWTLSLIMGGVGWHLWPLAQHVDMAAIGCALCWLVAVKHLNAGLALWDTATAHQRLRRIGERENTNHGQARWATWKEDLKLVGLHRGEGQLFLGELDGKSIYQQEGSTLILGGPGSSKTTGVVLNHLLRGNSSIVYDISREMLCVAGPALKRMNFRLWVLSPWDETFADQMGGAFEPIDTGFDPASFIDAGSPSVVEDCQLLASLLSPKPERSAGNEDYFWGLGQQILVAFMLYLLERDGKVTLVTLRSALYASQDELEKAIESMEASTSYSGVLAEEAARIAGVYVRSDKEFSGGMGSAQSAVKIYNRHGYLGKHVQKNGADFRRFRDEPTVCFIVIPSEKFGGLEADWLSMVTRLSCEMIARDRRSTPPVSIIVDELQNLPKNDSLLRGQALYRKQGLRYIYCVQYLSALRAIYGERYRDFLGVGAVGIYSATADLETLKLISELSGQETFRRASFSGNPDVAAGSELGMTVGFSDGQRPLLRPEDLRLLGPDECILLMPGVRPIRARKRRYLDWPALRRRAAPNPYYRQVKKPKKGVA